LNLDELALFVPVIWFYSFFDGLHRNSLPDEEYVQLKDEYLFVEGEFGKLNLKRYRIPAAVLLIFLGGYSLLHVLIEFLIRMDLIYWDSFWDYLYYDIPKVLFSVLIICLGIFLIRGKRVEMEQEDGGEA